MMIVNENYVVDFDDAMILSLSTGLRTSLGSNEVALLRYMIQQQGKLLLRQDLMEEVWLSKGIIVEDSSLLHAISNCRKALEDKDTQIIQTQRGKGYIFLGKVEPYSTEPLEDSEQEKHENAITDAGPANTTSLKNTNNVNSWWRYFAVYLLITVSSFMLWRQFSSPWRSAEYYYIEQFAKCVFTDPATATETIFQDVTIYHANGLSLLIDTTETSISYQDDSEVDCE
ncbi:winged helix-turn-helix domain-containing protein [Moritella sp. 24]|uniref:winged helix-turn-helix domain-containing protein n=1 Tax=Moritella sp. 24 TaxID=2746230 RepID=UPI001BA97675|nr:winged helix-turn-helix domain-containing protein [Moritella sp. 24]QUM75491.1 winged helix-turn-helix domain-containing protein [Moritella sp. 24]